MSQVIIHSGVFEQAAEHLGPPCKAAILSDQQVGALYAEPLARQLEQAGFTVVTRLIPAGEGSKDLHTYGQLLAFLAEQGLQRDDLVIALGGGVVGDVAGFAAATYLRGIRLAQIPTSLLAQVDSSVGGKTAIDLPQGKNLVGAFHPAQTVLIDPALLHSLPYEEYRNGLTEVVKCGAIRDTALLDLLPYDEGEQEEVIRRCVTLKQQIVAIDARDRGERQLLNFGHSFGHALERLSGYTLPHGEAVAMGMAIIARACAALGLCGQQDASRLLNTLRVLGLPIDTRQREEDIYTAMLGDKKRHAQGITLVLLRGLGDCYLQPVSLQRAREILRAGLGA